MKLIRFGIAGFLIQIGALWAFILISRTDYAPFGKPLVIVLAIVALGTLLWHEVRKTPSYAPLCLLPLVLSLGYLVAFHLLGLIGFRGLMKDLQFDIDYLWSILGVLVTVSLLYGIATTALALLARTRFRREP